MTRFLTGVSKGSGDSVPAGSGFGITNASLNEEFNGLFVSPAGITNRCRAGLAMCCFATASPYLENDVGHQTSK
ncbi:MAG: hypothetical protein ACE5NG_12240 [bacterium]